LLKEWGFSFLSALFFMDFKFSDKKIWIMGIINMTSDSFYGASRKTNLKEVIEVAETMVKEGADILDIGAESSRPGSLPISEETEIDRLKDIVPELTKRFSIPISVDTYKPKVAEYVLDGGATIVNDITGLKEFPETASIVARFNAGMILMHMQGTPQTMQENPFYENLISDIGCFLKGSANNAIHAGVKSDKIALDPGIGFGKTVEHNLKIIRELDAFQSLNHPIVLGVSRKSFIGKNLNLPVEERLEGSLAAAVLGLQKGARIFRVHDVKETVKAISAAKNILNI
jgi:dihydropteroate synthase